jgi:hypothetical protein
MPISFDQILNSRHFNAFYKEENVYGDRTIEDYMKDNAQNQLLESERVKEKFVILNQICGIINLIYKKNSYQLVRVFF